MRIGLSGGLNLAFGIVFIFLGISEMLQTKNMFILILSVVLTIVGFWRLAKIRLEISN